MEQYSTTSRIGHKFGSSRKDVEIKVTPGPGAYEVVDAFDATRPKSADVRIVPRREQKLDVDIKVGPGTYNL